MDENEDYLSESEALALSDTGKSGIFENKQEMIKIVVAFIFTVLVILIGWKMFILNQKIKQ